MTSQRYDLVVIGSGPAGQKGAIAAAKLGKRVAIIDRETMIGGVCLHTGTIPSKTLREAILYLTGLRQRAFYGRDYKLKQEISVSDLASRVESVKTREKEVISQQLSANGIATINGKARFVDQNRVEVDNNGDLATLAADYVLIACGTRPAHAPDIPFEGKRVLDADQLGHAGRIPRDLIVVGAGVIGIEYASMLAALGVKVTVIEQRPTLLDFADQEIIEALCFHLRRQGVVFRLGEKVTGVEINGDGLVHARMDSGKRVHAEGLLYAVGRQVNIDLLNVEAAGISVDSRGRLPVNECFQTNVPHVYAAGDCIGFPSLASTSMEQGRLAVRHMFGCPETRKASPFPYGIYTIPEISMVGKTERELTEQKLPYEVGVARYEEIAKGQMAGDDTGMLKILFDPDSLKLLGVHAIGEGAAEIIHVGQTVLAFDGGIEFFRVDVTDGAQLGGEQYTRELSEILSLQDEISSDIGEKLRLKLSSRDKRRPARRDVRNAEAYELYLKGRYHWSKWTEDGFRDAIACYEQALGKDPDFALAYSGLGETYGVLSYFTPDPAQAQGALLKAKAYAQRALEIDEAMAEAHLLLGNIAHIHEWDWRLAEREFRLALELNPNLAAAHQGYSLFLMDRRQSDEAIAEMELALQLDPLSLPINTSMGYLLFAAKRYDDAIDRLRKSVELDPNFQLTHQLLAASLEQKGQVDEAVAEYIRVIPDQLRDGEIASSLTRTFADSGMRGFMREYAVIAGELAGRRILAPVFVSAIYAMLGDRDAAFEWIERAFGERSPALSHIKADPRFESLHSDPRFGEMLRRMGLRD